MWENEQSTWFFQNLQYLLLEMQIRVRLVERFVTLLCVSQGRLVPLFAI